MANVLKTPQNLHTLKLLTWQGNSIYTLFDVSFTVNS